MISNFNQRDEAIEALKNQIENGVCFASQSLIL